MSTKQSTATINAILSVLKERGVDYELNGETSVKDVLTADDKAKVREILCLGFTEGKIDISESADAKHRPDGFKKYVNGLVNNWIRKHPPFNGGKAYKAKNPGSRAGSTDPQVKEMRKLLQVMTDEDQRAQVQAAIDKRVAEIKAEKNNVEIDASILPAHLRDLVKA